MTATDMAAIGDKLKKTRESRSLTIDQVQKQTRIHSSVLIALEEGRCDKMLTPTYVKSFLKKYSSHLGLDAKELMNEYLTAHPELRSQEPSSATQTKEPSTPRRKIDPAESLKKAQPFLVGLAAFAIIVLIAGGVTKFFIDRNRVHIVMAPKPQDVKSKKMISSRQKAPAKKASAPSTLIPNNQPLNLVVRAKHDVFIGATADGEPVFKRPLRKGTSETIIADVSIDLYIAKAESVALLLNGKSINPGKGVIKHLEITRKGARSK